MTIVAMILVALIIYHSYSFYEAFSHSLYLAMTSESRDALVNLVLATCQVTAYAITLVLMLVISTIM